MKCLQIIIAKHVRDLLTLNSGNQGLIAPEYLIYMVT
jgi:hypothetical protein